MNKKIYFIILCSSLSFTYGMNEPHNIHPILQAFLKNAITEATTIDEVADMCNKAVEEGLILPTIENADWCIKTFGYKVYKYGLCSFAHKLHSFNPINWLDQHLKTEQGLTWASSDLVAAIHAKNELLISFLLSTKNSKLANSITLSCAPTELVIRIEDKPDILQSLLNVGLIPDHLWNTGIATNRVLESHWALIHSAAYAGCPKITRLLVEHGADVNLLSMEDACPGETPLIVLVKTYLPITQSHLETAKILLEHGADPKALSKKKASELADPNNIGDIRGQLKLLIQSYEHNHKIM